MTKAKRLVTDMGYVDTTTESIMSGNGTCGVPCTKHKNVCGVPTKVSIDKCKKKECCDGK